jgi:hypothetical protein
MPRTGWVKSTTGHRLSAHLSWGLLARVFPPDQVDEAVEASGRMQQRNRLMPSRVVVYYVMGLALFSQSSYEEVMDSLVGSQSWSSGTTEAWPVPTKAALFKARARLGPEPLERLFHQVAKPMATRDDPDAFYRSWRLMSLDSADLDVPDTAANAETFGRPEAPGERRPLPQIRLVGLSATGTRAIVDARLGGLGDPVQELAAGILGDLPADALLLAGRGYFSYAGWVSAAATGADLLWRVWPDVELPVLERHADGSYSSSIHAEWPATRAPGTNAAGDIPVRVVEQLVPGTSTEGGSVSRLATTITDPAQAPAADLRELYSQRWKITSAFDELKAHHLSPRVVLRSKVPDGVRQEVYGYLCVHYAIRWLMHGVRGFSVERTPTTQPSK